MATDEDDTPIEMPGVMTFRIYPVSTAQEIPMSDDTTPIKPGYKTTEGWLAFLSACLGAAVTTHLVGDGSPFVTMAGLALTMAATLVHSWSRTTIKAAA